MLGSVKADIEKELKAEELKRVLKEQSGVDSVREILDDTHAVLNDIKQETASVVKQASDTAGIADESGSAMASEHPTSDTK